MFAYVGYNWLTIDDKRVESLFFYDLHFFDKFNAVHNGRYLVEQILKLENRSHN